MTNKESHYVFLCHAGVDTHTVRRLHDFLIKEGFDIWLNQENVLPRHVWKLETMNAIKNAVAVVICLSSKSVDLEGYHNAQSIDALYMAAQKPKGTIHIIPARLDECKIPDRLIHYEWVDLFSKSGYESLKRALNSRLESRNKKVISFVEKAVGRDVNTAQVTDEGSAEIPQKSGLHQDNHLQKLKTIHIERLRILELQSAKFGLSVPPHILLEIEEIKEKISQIDSQLQDIGNGDEVQNSKMGEESSADSGSCTKSSA